MNRILTQSDWGFHALYASDREQELVAQCYQKAKVLIVDCRKLEMRLDSVIQIMEESPDKLAYFFLHFQAMFSNGVSIGALRSSYRELWGKPRKNLVFCMTPETKVELQQSAPDWYEVLQVKPEMQFKDEELSYSARQHLFKGLSETSISTNIEGTDSSIGVNVEGMDEKIASQSQGDPIDDLLEQADKLRKSARYADALAFLGNLEELLRERYGNSYFRLASVKQYIGRVEYSKGAYTNALKLYEESLSQMVSLQSGYNLVGIYADIGSVHDYMGNYTQALRWSEMARTAIEQEGKADSFDMAAIYNNLGLVYSHLGQHQVALDLMGRARDMVEKLMGKEDPETASTYHNTALIYSSMGQYHEALDWLEKDRLISEKKLGTEHPDTATTYCSIAGVYAKMKKYKTALKWYHASLSIREKTDGANHPTTAFIYHQIAIVYSNMGKHGRALESYFRAKDIEEQRLDTAYSDIAAIYKGIAEEYYIQKKYSDAISYCRKCLNPKMSRSEAISVCELMSHAYADMGDYANALQALKTRAQIARK